jgi:hypothetical protein
MDSQANGKIWHTDYPELGTGPIPIEPCVSPAYFAQEREKNLHAILAERRTA